jgi:hypothetical protein
MVGDDRGLVGGWQEHHPKREYRRGAQRGITGAESGKNVKKYYPSDSMIFIT